MKEEPAILPQAEEPISSYSVKLDNFEGPLDLLLHLIKKEEINICDIPISRITSQYLEYIQMMEILNLEVAGEFILMAATLIRIKTRMLLPVTDQEEEIDPRAALVEALLEYQKFQEAAGKFETLSRDESQFYPRVDFSYLQIPDPVIELVTPSLYDLISNYRSVLARMPEPVQHDVNLPQVTVEERIDRIMTYLEDRAKVDLTELWQDIPLRIYMVVTFLATLELVRRGWVNLEQKKEFDTIYLWREKN